ncbi:MAG: hypothetical protein FD161_4653 [Limisphaerales bacterium]|nr:MAG: hypothetical protein FD161_4653 [Limisphaerales bacterium]KAG0506748.1 MAG: hypothetical protein E1N63_4094 [Limisphaerales bacterium]TXT46035.1 MAG: hypothetical protein FD140_4570 [Limisphaerales bacterium]
MTKALNKRKFIPFELVLDNARVIRIKHPECVMFNEAKTVAVVADGEHLHIVDLDHVSNLAMPTKAAVR